MLRIKLILDSFVLLCELLWILNHLVNLILGETSLIISDSYALCLSCASLFCYHTEYTVLINLECDFNLGDSSLSGRYAIQVKLPKQVIIFHKCSLTLIDGNAYLGLLILSGCERLCFLGRDHSPTGKDLRHHTSYGLNTEGQGSYINEQDILGLLRGLSTQDTSLNCGTISYGLIWVNTTVRIFTVEEVFARL